jgi:hypothetical protein
MAEGGSMIAYRFEGPHWPYTLTAEDWTINQMGVHFAAEEEVALEFARIRNVRNGYLITAEIPTNNCLVVSDVGKFSPSSIAESVRFMQRNREFDQQLTDDELTVLEGLDEKDARKMLEYLGYDCIEYLNIFECEGWEESDCPSWIVLWPDQIKVLDVEEVYF